MRFARWSLLALWVFAALAPRVWGQHAPAATTHRAAAHASLPDWEGGWEPDFGALMRSSSNPVFTAEYLEKQRALREKMSAGQPAPNPMQNCLPPGMPSTMELPYPVHFLFTPGKVTIIQEAFTQVRTVFTDGRNHPEDGDPAYNGHSIGRLEAGTLVIDTTQLRPDTYLPVRGADALPSPHSDALHIVERIRLAAPDRLEDHFTITDAKALAKPWEFSISYTRHRDWDLREYVCEENNRDQTDAAGHDLLRGVQK